MRTVGIWVSGLLASAIVGGFLGSIFERPYGSGELLWGAIAAMAHLHLRPPLAGREAQVVKRVLRCSGRVTRRMTQRWLGMKEWQKYQIKGDPAKLGAKLTTVRHIVHVPAARRIIEDGKIKAGLVYDESRLNRSRLSVAWVSANTWAHGSIYGTVEFQFDWQKLVDGQQIYWVEAMEKYNPTAYRFLLTTRSLSSGAIERYDPEKDDGPLRKIKNDWYWNYNYTSEFMIDEDLTLAEATGLDFVRHHPQYCRHFGASCVDREQNPSATETGSRILAYILAHKLTIIDPHLKPTQEQPRNDLLDMAFSGLHEALVEPSKFGGSLQQPSSCKKIATGALGLYGMDQLTSALDQLTLLKSAEGLKNAIIQIIREHFAAPDWTAPF